MSQTTTVVEGGSLALDLYLLPPCLLSTSSFLVPLLARPSHVQSEVLVNWSRSSQTAVVL